MSNVNTSAVLIQDAMSLCEHIIEILSFSQKDMKRKHQSAGNDWKDSKYQQLGDIVNECSISIRKSLDELNRCCVSLGEIKKSIADYDSVNLSGLSPYMPVTSEYSNEYMQLVEQYSNETDDAKREQIRALGELNALEYTLGLGDGDPNTHQMGGLYGDIRGKLRGYHAHHIPPKSVSDIHEDCLPAIFLTAEDHALTASYGGRMRSRPVQSPFEFNAPSDTRTYGERLIAQINEGNYADAFRNEVYEIRHLFGERYDGAIRQAIEANRHYIQTFGNPRVNER